MAQVKFKFKIGDKVRVIARGSNGHNYPVGTNTIYKVNVLYTGGLAQYGLKDDSGWAGNWIEEECIVHANRKEEVKSIRARLKSMEEETEQLTTRLASLEAFETDEDEQAFIISEMIKGGGNDLEAIKKAIVAFKKIG